MQKLLLLTGRRFWQKFLETFASTISYDLVNVFTIRMEEMSVPSLSVIADTTYMVKLEPPCVCYMFAF